MRCAIKTLGDVAEYINGRAFKPSEWEESGLPIIRIQNLTDKNAPCHYSSAKHEEKYLIHEGDLLFAWAASLGAHIWQGQEAWLNQHIFKIIPHNGIAKKYLYYFLLHTIAQLYSKSHGSGMVHITKGPFLATQIPVPSLDEQERIVAKIEELFSKIDKTEETLRLTQIQLSLYKQSVLKHAFTLEADSISLEKACTKIFDGPFGSHLKSSDYIADGIRVVRLENIKDGWFDTSKRSFVSESKYETIKSHTVISGDLIMSTFLSDKVKVCKLPADIPFAVNKADCVGIRLKKEFSADFIQYFLLSRYVYRQLINNVHGATRPRVNTTQIKEISIPTIPLEQQVAIATNIEAKLSICNNIEATIQQTQRQIESLRQSILKKAFEGKLV